MNWNVPWPYRWTRWFNKEVTSLKLKETTNKEIKTEELEVILDAAKPKGRRRKQWKPLSTTTYINTVGL